MEPERPVASPGEQPRANAASAAAASNAPVQASDAPRLARLWVRQFGSGMKRALVRAVGDTVVAANLAPCGAPLYAESSYDAPDASAPVGVRRSLGDKWLVTMCDGSAPAAIVAVAADLGALRVESDSLVFPSEGGGEFSMLAIGSYTGVNALPPGDSIARLVASLARERVALAPRLILPSANRAPQLARWRLDLARPVQMTVAGTGRRAAATEVYVGYEPATGAQPVLFVAAAAQPARESVRGADVDPKSKAVTWTDIPLRRRAGIATAHERTMLGGGAQ